MADTGGIDIGNLTADELKQLLSGDEEPESTTSLPTSSQFVSIGGRTVRRGPIGVGDTYRAPYRNQRLSQSNQMSASQGDSFAEGIAPQYFEDDLTGFATMSPESMTQVQYMLKNAGLLKAFRKGVWADDEEGAMAKVLAYANRRGLVWEDALAEFAEMGEVIGGTGGGGRAFTARLSNPDDLKKAFTQSLYDAQGGRFFDETQMQQMVDAYQQIEYGAQRAAFDNAGTVEEPPSAATFAEHRAKEIDAAGVQAAKLADYGQVFEELIGQ